VHGRDFAAFLVDSGAVDLAVLDSGAALLPKAEAALTQRHLGRSSHRNMFASLTS
jgi:RecA/RadA recombinase